MFVNFIYIFFTTLLILSIVGFIPIFFIWIKDSIDYFLYETGKYFDEKLQELERVLRKLYGLWNGK